jgi:streptogramin lyase
MGTDKAADVLWVADSFGGNYARIDTKTQEVKLVPLPDPQTLQPYHVTVDSKHGAWTNMWSTDRITRYDPVAGKWTVFDLPSRGTEARYISVLEREGQPMQVVVPYSRVRKVATMTFRTEDEIAKAKAAAK